MCLLFLLIDVKLLKISKSIILVFMCAQMAVIIFERFKVNVAYFTVNFVMNLSIFYLRLLIEALLTFILASVS